MIRRNSEYLLGKKASVKENSYSSGDETSSSGQTITNNDGVRKTLISNLSYKIKIKTFTAG